MSPLPLCHRWISFSGPLWIALVLNLVCLPARAVASGIAVPEEGSGPWYFYHGRDYGSEALVHPLRLILNGGFGILQLDNLDASPWEIDYARGIRIVARNLSDPVGAIQEDGWWEFTKREILPVSVDSDGGQYWPNYMNHLIGGGMSFRLMSEWYRWHGWEHPRWWAAGTIFAYHFLNEIVENRDVEKWTTDPVADVLLFDPLGMWLFSQDRVARFFSERLHMHDWSYQISYDVGEERWVNNGQNFAMKLDLPWFRSWRLFYHFGTHAELGMSYRLPNGDELSVGAGLVAKNLLPSDGNFRTVDLARSAGIWWDRDGSLLASVDWAQGKAYHLRANLYPGVIGWRGWRPGLFGILHRDEELTLGLSVSWSPIGLAERL